MHDCPGCGFTQNFTLAVEGNHTFNSYLPTVFAKSINKQIACKYTLTRCSCCGLTYFLHDNYNLHFGFSNSSIKQKEPIHHVVSVGANILEVFSPLFQLESSNIITSSYKDDYLKSYLTQHMQLKPLRSCNKLLLSTRYIEHLSSYNNLIDYLRPLEYGDYIYIEMLDFLKISDNGDQSFFWCERICYPTKHYMLETLEFLGFQLIVDCDVENDLEPFWWMLLRRVSFPSDSSLRIVKAKQPDYHMFFVDILTHASKFVSKFDTIYCYGMNHKMFMLLDIILANNMFRSSDIKMFDSNPCKIGSYWNGIEIQPISGSIGCSDANNLHIFAFSLQQDSNLCRDIISSHPHSHIAHINDLLALDTD